jgi:hypothetical protein
MDDKRIFELAEKHGWQDDFGRWNFKDDGLISFACSMVREHTPDHVKQITEPWSCPHGIEDGACKQCYEDQTKPKMRRATRKEKIVNPGVYEVPVHSLPYPMQEGKDFTISKPWVGLTKEEIYDVFNNIVIHENRPDSRYQDFARAIEAILNRKNV